MANSDTTLLESWELREEVREEGFVKISIGGEGHCTAIINAVAANYHRCTGRSEVALEDLEAHVDADIGVLGKKVTLIYGGENDFGAGMLKAREGRLFSITPGTVSILPKGARSRGWRIDIDKVIDLIPGYETAEAKRLVGEVRGQFPTLATLTQERLGQLPAARDDGSSATASLCVFGTWRLPDGAATDAVWLLTEYDTENDICDGALLIRPEYGYSEHGSCYGEQLLRGPFGEVVGFESISFADAVGLCDLDYEDAVARVLPTYAAPAVS